jgi:two-component system, LytTR family, response regulator
MLMRAVIVEDEQASRERLRRLMRRHEDRVLVVGEADSGPSAVEAVKRHEPDLLLLDVSLPGFDGFELLKNLSEPPAVIFTTAHDEYAVRAFRASAVDYLLKPIDEEQLAAALVKASNAASPQASRQWEQVLAMFRSLQERECRRVACRVGDATIFVPVEDIQFFRADEGYTLVKTSAKELLIDTPLVELEARLNPPDFVRIHRGTLVNMRHVASFKRTLDGRLKVALTDGTELPTSRRYAENLRNLT